MDYKFPRPTLGSYGIWTSHTVSGYQIGRSQEEIRGTCKRPELLTGTSRHDPGCKAICREDPQCEDTVTQLAAFRSHVWSCCSLGSRTQMAEISPLLHILGLDQNHVWAWIDLLWMVIQHKPTRCPDIDSNMQYAFNSPRGIAWIKIVPHIREDETTGVGNLPPSLQHIEAAFCDLNREVTTEHNARRLPKRAASSLCTMPSLKLLLPTTTAIPQNCEMLWGCGCLRKWKIELLILICKRIVSSSWLLARSGIPNWGNHKQGTPSRIDVKGQVAPHRKSLLPPQWIPQAPPWEMVIDIQDQHTWSSGHAGE